MKVSEFLVSHIEAKIVAIDSESIDDLIIEIDNLVNLYGSDLSFLVFTYFFTDKFAKSARKDLQRLFLIFLAYVDHSDASQLEQIHQIFVKSMEKGSAAINPKFPIELLSGTGHPEELLITIYIAYKTLPKEYLDEEFTDYLVDKATEAFVEISKSSGTGVPPHIKEFFDALSPKIPANIPAAPTEQEKLDAFLLKHNLELNTGNYTSVVELFYFICSSGVEIPFSLDFLLNEVIKMDQGKKKKKKMVKKFLMLNRVPTGSFNWTLFKSFFGNTQALNPSVFYVKSTWASEKLRYRVIRSIWEQDPKFFCDPAARIKIRSIRFFSGQRKYEEFLREQPPWDNVDFLDVVIYLLSTLHDFSIMDLLEEPIHKYPYVFLVGLLSCSQSSKVTNYYGANITSKIFFALKDTSGEVPREMKLRYHNFLADLVTLNMRLFSKLIELNWMFFPELAGTISSFLTDTDQMDDVVEIVSLDFAIALFLSRGGNFSAFRRFITRRSQIDRGFLTSLLRLLENEGNNIKENAESRMPPAIRDEQTLAIFRSIFSDYSVPDYQAALSALRTGGGGAVESITTHTKSLLDQYFSGFIDAERFNREFIRHSDFSAIEAQIFQELDNPEGKSKEHLSKLGLLVGYLIKEDAFEKEDLIKYLNTVFNFLCAPADTDEFFVATKALDVFVGKLLEWPEIYRNLIETLSKINPSLATEIQRRLQDTGLERGASADKIDEDYEHQYFLDVLGKKMYINLVTFHNHLLLGVDFRILENVTAFFPRKVISWVNMFFSSLSKGAVEAKSREFQEYVNAENLTHNEFWVWIAETVCMRRINISHNATDLFIEFFKSLQSKPILTDKFQVHGSKVVRDTVLKRVLYQILSRESNPKWEKARFISDLGRFVGALFPITDIPVENLLLYSYLNGKLYLAVPFIVRLLMSLEEIPPKLLAMLKSIAALPFLKRSVVYEIEKVMSRAGSDGDSDQVVPFDISMYKIMVSPDENRDVDSNLYRYMKHSKYFLNPGQMPTILEIEDESLDEFEFNEDVLVVPSIGLDAEAQASLKRSMVSFVNVDLRDTIRSLAQKCYSTGIYIAKKDFDDEATIKRISRKVSWNIFAAVIKADLLEHFSRFVAGEMEIIVGKMVSASASKEKAAAVAKANADALRKFSIIEFHKSIKYYENNPDKIEVEPDKNFVRYFSHGQAHRDSGVSSSMSSSSSSKAAPVKREILLDSEQIMEYLVIWVKDLEALIMESDDDDDSQGNTFLETAGDKIKQLYLDLIDIYECSLDRDDCLDIILNTFIKSMHNFLVERERGNDSKALNYEIVILRYGLINLKRAHGNPREMMRRAAETVMQQELGIEIIEELGECELIDIPFLDSYFDHLVQTQDKIRVFNFTVNLIGVYNDSNQMDKIHDIPTILSFTERLLKEYELDEATSKSIWDMLNEVYRKLELHNKAQKEAMAKLQGLIPKFLQTRGEAQKEEMLSAYKEHGRRFLEKLIESMRDASSTGGLSVDACVGVLLGLNEAFLSESNIDVSEADQVVSHAFDILIEGMRRGISSGDRSGYRWHLSLLRGLFSRVWSVGFPNGRRIVGNFLQKVRANRATLESLYFLPGWMDLISVALSASVLETFEYQEVTSRFTRELVSLLEFSLPIVRIGRDPSTLGGVLKRLYVGIAKMLLVISHDFRLYMSQVCLQILSVIPTEFVQLNKIVRVAFPPGGKGLLNPKKAVAKFNLKPVKSTSGIARSSDCLRYFWEHVDRIEKDGLVVLSVLLDEYKALETLEEKANMIREYVMLIRKDDDEDFYIANLLLEIFKEGTASDREVMLSVIIRDLVGYGPFPWGNEFLLAALELRFPKEIGGIVSRYPKLGHFFGKGSKKDN